MEEGGGEVVGLQLVTWMLLRAFLKLAAGGDYVCILHTGAQGGGGGR